MQLLATILFFIVFIELVLALTMYLVVSVRDFIKAGKKASAKAEEPPHV